MSDWVHWTCGKRHDPGEPCPSSHRSYREVVYEREWITQHSKADEIVCEESTGKIVAAIYYYPLTHDEADNKKLWKVIAARMEVERLKELDSE